MNRYVRTSSFSDATKILGSKHYVVISGPPGVGKSKLAEMLTLTHYERGWQVVNVPYDIERAWDAWVRDRRQIFYVDDFFGQTSVEERLGRNIGSTIRQLIQQVERRPDKRLILTTRRHILRQAELRDEELDFAHLQDAEYVVELGGYSLEQRARLLYNHLYYSEQSRDVIRQYVRSKHFLAAIKHPNFAPRVIEQILHQPHASGDGLSSRLVESLNHPMLVWGPSFTRALSETSRDLLLWLTTFRPSGIAETELRRYVEQASTPIEYTDSFKNA